MSEVRSMQGRTMARTRTAVEPLRAFLVTESGGAGVLAAAVVAALVWANIDHHSYELVWRSTLSISVGEHRVARDLRTWVNDGLMTLIFLVVGLEARREIDLGELRDRRRILLPVTVGLLALAVPVGLYLAVNASGDGARGWGVAMSTDTALALGAVSLVGRALPERTRVFLLTMFIVDDLVSLIVIAVAYGQAIHLTPLLVAVGTFLVLLGALRLRVHRPGLYLVLGVVVWSALLSSGVDPVVSGLAIGLAVSAYAPSRDRLEEATGLFRRFREQPTPDLARGAASGLRATLSPNARLQRVYHRWTRYLIVPLFGLANAGIVLREPFLSNAYQSTITLGVMLAYLAGKPIAVIGGSAALTRLSGGRLRPPVGWAAVTAGGTIAGTGFTVSFLIATLTFTGTELDEAKLGVLSADLLAAALTVIVIRATALLPPARRTRALLGDLDQLGDLAVGVDPGRDHIRGAADAMVTVVEYGDFECEYCGRAESSIRADLAIDDDVRYVWRHLPLTDVHPHAQLAAEAAEAAAAQGGFWPMHDLLLARQDELDPPSLLRHAQELGLDVQRFHDDLRRHKHAGRVAQDVESADLSGVSGTPSFFINGQRHHGAYDISTLTSAIRTARARAQSRRETVGRGR
jgi:Na+/H+ antiporter NhaA